MEYKGYVGKAEIDDEAGIYHGEVVNTRDVITFQGRSVVELENAFKDSIDDYLKFCDSRSEEPETPF
jgi:predicted HicB family RNase H-like nuclease